MSFNSDDDLDDCIAVYKARNGSNLLIFEVWTTLPMANKIGVGIECSSADGKECQARERGSRSFEYK
jgi:hypothetical protein